MQDSPAKKLNFTTSENKENSPFDAPVVEAKVDLTKPATEVLKENAAAIVASTIKVEESDEPLLQENPHRFVLFPIKYHEVRVVSHVLRVKWSNCKLTVSV